MADGTFPSLVSRTRDPNTASNVLFVQIADNAGNAVSVTGTELDVNIAFDYAVDSVAGGSDLGALVLAVRDDVLTTLTPADGDYVQLRTDANGALWVNTTGTSTTTNTFQDDSAFIVGTDDVMSIGFLANETAPDSVDEGDIGIPRMTLDRKVLVRIVGASDVNRWDVDAAGLGQVDVAAHALTNANAVPISRDNAANSETNPLYVHNVDTVVSGEEVHDYDTSVNVAVDTVDNHDYTVAGTTFFLKSVIISASGNIKAEIQTGPLATLVTKAVVFLNGRQGDTQQVFFDPAIEVPVASTGTVRVARTNRQGATMDVYSTIIGNDV